jgi:hypothetical protein
MMGLAKAFFRFDTSGDGLLDPHEFVYCAQFLGLQFNLNKCALLIAEVDQDSDGELDFLEFIGCLKLHAMQDHIQQGHDMKIFSFRKFGLKQFPGILGKCSKQFVYLCFLQFDFVCIKQFY